MKGSPLAAKLALEVGAHQLAFTSTAGTLKRTPLEEMPRAIDVLKVPLPQRIVISHDAQFALRRKHTMELAQRVILHHATFVMTRLGPRIAELEMNHRDDLVGHTRAEKLGGIATQEFHVG